MEIFWTSRKPLMGLRHFVLINEIEKGDTIVFLLVSVVDAEINFEITHKELLNSVNWEKGWLDLTKKESITKDYSKYKSMKQQNESLHNTRGQKTAEKIVIKMQQNFLHLSHKL